MILTKEFKGNTKNPNVDEQINAFLETLTEEDQLADIMYSTLLTPVKRDGQLSYISVSSALVLYDKAEREE